MKRLLIYPILFSFVICQEYEPDNAAYYYSQMKLFPFPSKFTDDIEHGKIELPNSEVSEYLKKNEDKFLILEKALLLDTCFFNKSKDKYFSIFDDLRPLYNAGTFLYLSALNAFVDTKIDTVIKRYQQMTKILQHGYQNQGNIIMWKSVELLMVDDLTQLINKVIENEATTSQQLQELLNISINAKKLDGGLGEWVKYKRVEDVNTFAAIIEDDKEKLISQLIDSSINVSDETKNKLIEMYYDRLVTNYKKEYNKYLDALLKYCNNNQSLDYEKNDFDFSFITDIKLSINDVMLLTGENPDHYIQKSYFDDMTKIAASLLVGLTVSMDTQMVERYYITRASWDISIIGLAIKLFEKKHKRWPFALNKKELQDLKFLNKDPWNSFRPYKILKRDDNLYIYSLGPDRKNNKAKKQVDYIIYEIDPDKEGDIFIELQTFH